jgi:hypothetical protein
MAASVALAVLIGWLVGLQAVGVGRDRDVPASLAARRTTAVLGAGAALLVVPRLHAHGLLSGPGVTAVALIALIGWLVGLQAVRVGWDSRVMSPRAMRETTAVLAAGVLLLAVPDLYHLLVA